MKEMINSANTTQDKVQCMLMCQTMDKLYDMFQIQPMVLIHDQQIHIADAQGNIPLHLACSRPEKESIEIIEALCLAGSNLNAQNSKGRTPLMTAIRKDLSINHIATLVKHAPKLEVQTPEGFTALTCAVFKHRHDIAELLIQRGANVNILTTCGSDLLHLAVQDDTMKELLISAGAQQNYALQKKIETLVTPFQISRTPEVKRTRATSAPLLHHHSDNVLTKVDTQQLIKAIEAKNIPQLRQLIDCDIDVNAITPDGHTALSKTTSIQMCDMLLTAGADPNLIHTEEQIAPLHKACAYHNVRLVRLLLEKRPDHSKKANPNVVDSKGSTPLHYTVANVTSEKNDAAIEIINLLLQYGANPNVQNHQGDTALHTAIMGATPECVGYLLKRGANLYLENKNKLHPLALANTHERSTAHAQVIQDYMLAQIHNKEQNLEEISLNIHSLEK